jgi:hypothetical protein
MASAEQAAPSSNVDNPDAAPQGTEGTPAETVEKPQVPFTPRFPFTYDHSADIPPAYYAAARRNMAAQMSGPVEVFPPLSALPTPTAGTAPSEINGTLSKAALHGVGGLTANAAIQSGQRTRIRVALIANYEPIIINIDALLVLLDDKIAALDRSNSDEARADLERYQQIRRELEKLHIVTTGFAVGKLPEADAVATPESFAKHIREWWDKHHNDICDKAFNAAIFLSCVGICKLCGAAGDLSVIVSGVLAGGKTVTDALRAAAGLQKH